MQNNPKKVFWAGYTLKLKIKTFKTLNLFAVYKAALRSKWLKIKILDVKSQGRGIFWKFFD